MASRGQNRARATQPQDTNTGEGLTEHPITAADPVGTATDGAPEGVKYGEPRLAEGSDYAERPYAEALSPDHAEVLREAGQHPDEG
jgi:hypothetical protein